ncbi:ribonuclease T2-like protein [Absidia repens]|uniref:Ribonuclease T2-like protein n=1 Tax=Absidia repens TaxID=90262 RepID=A0A1X2I8E9_9FUNG|nr:ribonuclease T2-like protein [Absidia repens]
MLVNALSCSNNAGGSCCSPVDGLVLLVQRWYEGLGPENSFTMGGLWSNTCSGAPTPREGCDVARHYPNLDSILQKNQTLYNDMVKYWPSGHGPPIDAQYWTHAWYTHGTCVTTLDPKCFSNPTEYQDVYGYFGAALQLCHDYDFYTMLSDANITPGATYTLDQLESAIEAQVGFKPKISCKGSTLNEMSLFFKVVNGTQYIVTDRTLSSTSCRGRNYINYPRKYS